MIKCIVMRMEPVLTRSAKVQEIPKCQIDNSE